MFFLIGNLEIDMEKSDRDVSDKRFQMYYDIINK